MTMIRCSRDLHFYDSNKHASCPYCNDNNLSIQEKRILLGRYEIISEIGKGAFSTVFRANDHALDRKVALKCFSQIKDEPTIARIQREATIWSKIKHPNIVSLYDVLNYEGNLYLVLEYIEGASLESILEKIKIIEIKRAVQYQKYILTILSYLHSQSIIHRDIKPSNIIITENHRVFLTDFTTGKIFKMKKTITEVGAHIGTVLYMSPEQSKSENTTYLSDIYSAGVVFFEMLTGKLPFDAPSIYELISKINNEPVPLVSEIRSSIPMNIEKFINLLLAKNSSDRPSADESIKIIENIIETTDWDEIEKKDKLIPIHINDVKNIVETKKTEKGFRTKAPTKKNAKPTGFFANDLLRFEEFNRSVDFFRSHIDKDYSNLLNQAKLSFWLWIGCVTISFVILLVGIILVYKGDIVAGTITLASDTLVFFIQNLFKQKEEYYRIQADIKQKHLEIGSIWNLAVQSADGISDPGVRSQKIAQVIDALISHVTSHFKEKDVNITSKGKSPQ